MIVSSVGQNRTGSTRAASTTTGAPVPSVLKSAAPKPAFMPFGDAARVLGTLVVVIGHVCDMIVFANPPYSLNDWRVCNLADAASRWAVPVYVMLSGSLLLDPNRAETASQFYKKRLARLGVPILFWSALYMWLSVYYTGWATPEQAWRDLALGKPYVHLHFIFRIAGLYAFTPVIRIFLKHAEEKLIVTITVLCLFLASGDSVTNAFTGSESSMFLRFIPFVGYYLLGYVLRNRMLTKRSLLGCWMLAISCVLLLAGGTELLARMYGPVPYPSRGFMLYDFLSPVRVAFAVSAWLIIVNTFDRKWAESGPGQFVSKWLAPMTLGIYLAHLLFREILTVHGFNAVWPNVWIGIPLMTAMIYIPSCIFVFVVMRIPYLKRIVL